MEETPTPTAACSWCGAPDAQPMDDRFICDACYIARGSCCAEWFEDEESCAEEPSSPGNAKT